MDTKQKLKLKKFISQLKGIKGRHTELISVYIPEGYDIIKIIQHLAQEQGTAQNIKDKSTRKNVIDSLERMIRHLRLFPKTPKNGLAAFAGDISDNPSKNDIQIFSLEPPEPLNLRLYRCDHDFKLDVLEEMLDFGETYGLIVMDNRDGSVGTMKGTRIEFLKEMHSAVPGKTKAGGQCLTKDTIISMADGQFLKIEEVEEGDEVLSFDFNENGKTKAAETLTPHDFLLDEKANPVKIREVLSDLKMQELIDLEIENKNFIANGIIVHNSQQRFARLREIAAHEFWHRIAEFANKEFLPMKNLKGIILGGPGMTKDKFLSGAYLNNELKKKVIAVKDLSYTGEFGLKELVERCQDELAQEEIILEKKAVNEFLLLAKTNQKKCVYGLEKTKKALELGVVEKLLLSEVLDNTDELEELASQMGTEILIVSKESEEGQQLKNIGGIAGILRYEIDL